jgi:hypothetical protein
METLTSVPLVESEQEFLDKVIAGHRGHPGALHPGKGPGPPPPQIPATRDP